MATRAGIALAVQLDRRLGLESWLHALFEDLLAHKSRELFAAHKDGGINLRVCEASATYSARLEREALEQLGAAEPKPVRNPEPANQNHKPPTSEVSGLNYRSNLKRLIALQFAKNTKASDLEICRALDADGGLELPASWVVGTNRLFEIAYKNPRLRPRIEAYISKVRADLRKLGLIRCIGLRILSLYLRSAYHLPFTYHFKIRLQANGRSACLGKANTQKILTKMPGLPTELVLYCGRHDYGTRVLRETGNLAAVMKTMGHKDVRTAMRYQHPELDIVRDALNATQTMTIQ